MNWTENEVLLNQRETMPSKDLFQAVCDEIGKHYETKGFKYSRSRPKLTFKDKVLKLEICFWSSRSNTSGRHVSLEILPNFYSLRIINSKTSNGKSKISNGFLFGHEAIFSRKYTDNPKQQRVNQIYGDVLERLDDSTYESQIRDNHYCNVYGIDEEKFKRIIEFIDKKIIPWIENLKTKEGVLEFTENPTKQRLFSINGQGGNSDFIQYCKIHFPEIDIEKRLEI
jgi:hypothetical protein